MNRYSIKILIYAAIAAGIAIAGFYLHALTLQRRPNVIIVLLDAARQDRFSCYGYEKQTTPGIDKIAMSGMIFENHFACSTMTQASLPQLFSSRYVSKEMFNVDGRLWGIKREKPSTIFRDYDPQQTTIQHILSRNGYKTAIFTQHACVDRRSYLAKSFQEYLDLPLAVTDRAETLARAVNPISEWLSKNRKNKFFAYVHIMLPHSPYPEEIENKDFFADAKGHPLPAHDIAETRSRMHAIPLNSGTNPDLNELQSQCLSGLYDSNLNFADEIVKALHNVLKKHNLIKNTLFIITSDHGENLGEQGYIGHGTVPWDTMIRVPLIISYPGFIPAGTKHNGLTETVDIMPTVLGICRLKLPPGKSMDGFDMLPHSRQREKNAVFTAESIRTDQYKYIVSQHLLYAVAQDPGENHNIVSSQPDIVHRLKKQFIGKTTPYFQRFQNAVKRERPEEPFYYPVTALNALTAENVITDTTDIERLLTYKEYDGKFENGNKIIRNISINNEQIFFIAGKQTDFKLTLKARVPSGRYTIALLCSTAAPAGDIPHSSLRFRFDQQSPFSASTYMPFRTPSADDPDKSSRYYYALLNETAIPGNEFFLEIELPVAKNILAAIHHVIFYPVGFSGLPGEKKNHKNFEKKLKKLKLLGYM